MRVQRNLSILLTVCSAVSGLVLTSAHAAPPLPQAGAKAATSSSASIAANSSAKTRAEPLQRATVPSTVQGRGAASTDAAIGPEEHARRLQAALAGLKGSDPVAIQSALLSLQELEGRAAAEGIVARLKLGLPPQLSETALVVLGGLNQPIAVPVLSELTLHRRWQIREKAVAALGGLRVRSSVSVLLYALDDPSAEVRSAAARALGMVGDPRASSALNAALERGVDGALEGLAGLATSRQVDAILARAKGALSTSGAALSVLLSRANLPLATKLKVIQLVQTHEQQQEATRLIALWKDDFASDRRLVAALSAAPSAVLHAPAAHAPAKAVEGKPAKAQLEAQGQVKP